MFRYFRRHLPLAIAALFISMLTPITIPIAALMERQMIDLIIAGDLKAFQEKLILAGVIVAMTALAYFLNALIQKSFQVRFLESLRNDLFDGLMRQSHANFIQKDTAEQMSYVKSHASTIANNLTRPIFTLFSYGIMAIVVLGVMLYYSPVLALVSLICALLSIIPPLQFNKKLGNQLLKKLETDAATTHHLKEALNGHETIQAFGVFPQFRKRFVHASRNQAKTDYSMDVTISLLENIARVTQKVTWFISFLIAGNMTLKGDISVGTLVMFITLFGELNTSVTLYAQMLPILLSTRPDIKELTQIIDSEDPNSFDGLTPTLENKIQVKDLCFGYLENVPIIRGLNLEIRKNEKVSLIGASGCGKSTFIKLLSGNFTNYTGAITYDGTELREIDVHQLSNLLTVIHQDTMIFNDSVRFNICLGEEFPPDELQNALHLSGVERFLRDIPHGLDATCGENGSLLSGGQKQRIALARAIIRGVKMLILDEGTSAIDVASANEIERELLSMNDLTLLTITHRIKDGLSEHYDRILMMEEGRIIREKANDGAQGNTTI